MNTPVRNVLPFNTISTVQLNILFATLELSVEALNICIAEEVAAINSALAIHRTTAVIQTADMKKKNCI